MTNLGTERPAASTQVDPKPGRPGTTPSDPTATGYRDRPGLRGTLRRVVIGLLRVPLFYKVFLANIVIVTIAVLLTAWLTRGLVDASATPATALVWVGLGLCVLLLTLGANAALIRVALAPLQDLEQTARNVPGDDSVQRVPISPVADRDLRRIIQAFNAMLEQSARYRGRLRELAAHALTAQEAERARIARELHDDTAQRIAAINLHLRVLGSSPKGQALAEQLGQIRDDLEAAVEGLRRIARGLRPPALDDLGLVPAVQAHARELRERSDVRIEVESPVREPTLPRDTELAAYRIIQEALSNALRHADASRVRVSFAETGDRWRIVIQDDGRGFAPPDPSVVPKEEALGLLGMQERALYVGGRTQIESRPGSGTRIVVHLAPTPSAS